LSDSPKLSSNQASGLLRVAEAFVSSPSRHTKHRKNIVAILMYSTSLRSALTLSVCLLVLLLLSNGAYSVPPPSEPAYSSCAFPSPKDARTNEQVEAVCGAVPAVGVLFVCLFVSSLSTSLTETHSLSYLVLSPLSALRSLFRFRAMRPISRSFALPPTCGNTHWNAMA
jgi:hypothetical protein